MHSTHSGCNLSPLAHNIFFNKHLTHTQIDFKFFSFKVNTGAGYIEFTHLYLNNFVIILSNCYHLFIVQVV